MYQYQVLFRIISRYAPIITFPVAVILGGIGYNIEKIFPREQQKLYDSVYTEREQRFLEEISGKKNETASCCSKQILNK
jgi:hypothetical protein